MSKQTGKARGPLTVRGLVLSAPKIGEPDQMLVTKGGEVLGTVHVSKELWAALVWHQKPEGKRGPNPQWGWRLPQEEEVQEFINEAHKYIEAYGPNEWLRITPRLRLGFVTPLPAAEVWFVVERTLVGGVVGYYKTMQEASDEVTRRMEAAHNEDALLRWLGLQDVAEKASRDAPRS